MSSSEATDTTLPPTQLFIDGKWVPANSKQSFDAFDPRTGAVITQVHQADQTDVDAAVAAARKGLTTLAKMTPLEKSALLNKLADLVEAHVHEIAHIETYPSNLKLDLSMSQIWLASNGFEMCVCYRNRHLGCGGSQPKHVSNPDSVIKKLNPFGL